MGNSLIKVKGKVSTEEVEFIVDTGATYSVIPESLAAKLQLKTIGTVNLDTGGGAISLPMVEAPIEVNGKTKSTLIAVADNSKPLILGMKYLAATGFVIDPSTGKLKTLDGSDLWKQKVATYIAIALVAIGIPVALKVAWPHMAGVDTSFVMTFFVLLAGCLYELFNPWISKMIAYRKVLTTAMEKGEQTPSIEEYFKHGIVFNKWYAIFQGINFAVALGISLYLLYSGSVVYQNWISNVVFNFGYAVGQSRILKERIFG